MEVSPPLPVREEQCRTQLATDLQEVIEEVVEEARRVVKKTNQ